MESQVDHRAAAIMAVATGAVAAVASRVAEFPLVGELAAAAVAPRPRSPERGRAGCARATGIRSETAPNQIYQGCGEEGHHITKCEKTENAVRAVEIPSRT